MDDYQLNKGDVKQLFLSVMNGGKREGITEPFFTKLKTECETIHTFISSLYPKLYKDVCKRKEFDVYEDVCKRKEFDVNGSLTNIILCNLENEILLNAVQYLISKDFIVDVLVFFGCMIRKEEDKEITPELLNGLNRYVFEKTGYDIKFIEKDLDTYIDLCVSESPNNDIEASITYYKDKEEFENPHLIIIHPPIYISMIKGKFELQSRDGLFQSYQDMKTIIKNKKMVKK
jgi:hypothetical protein